MAKQAGIVTRQMLANVPLPDKTPTYTPITHQNITDEVYNQFALNNFTITDSIHKMNDSGEVAMGVYHINHGDDDDLGLMFAWVNSYDKSLRFRCAIGAYVKANMGVIVTGDLEEYSRLHTGNADTQVEETIKYYISKISHVYDKIKVDKTTMQAVLMNDVEVSALLGRLFVKEDCITSGQMIIVKNAYDKMRKEATQHSLWDIYMHIINALSTTAPKAWIKQQVATHTVLRDNYFIKTTESVKIADENQLNLLDQMEEMTQCPSPEETIIKPVAEEISLESYEDAFSDNVVEPTPHESEMICREEAELSAENMQFMDDEDDEDEIIEPTSTLDLDEEEDADWSHMKAIEPTIEKTDNVVDLTTDPRDMIVDLPLTNLDGSEPEAVEVVDETPSETFDLEAELEIDIDALAREKTRKEIDLLVEATNEEIDEAIAEHKAESKNNNDFDLSNEEVEEISTSDDDLEFDF